MLNKIKNAGKYILRLVKSAMRFVYINKKTLGKILLVVLVLCFIAFSWWVSTFYRNSPQKEWENQAQSDKKDNIVRDVTGLYPIKVNGVIVPHTTEEIQEAVRTHSKISIGGGRNSMGGQTASEDSVQIDMREFNKILDFSTSTKEITVQTGIRWREIQDKIDPENLSVKVMQTYSNFTVGGSLSVNVHGRYLGLGPIVMSVNKIKLVLADGQAVIASPTENQELFYSAIGGMGGIGIITEATLSLADNVNVKRERIKIPVEEYKDHFFNNVRSSDKIIFHNGDIYPMDFDTVSAVNWTETNEEVTTNTKLIPRAKDYVLERIAWVIMSEWPFGDKIRQYIIDPLIYSKNAVHSRNYEASYDVAELEPVSRKDTTYVLQEYFVPVEKFNDFYPKMKDTFIANDVNVLNVSIRHAIEDPGSKLAWAKGEVFAFVVYYKQGTDDESKAHVAKWTREMIDRVLSVGGTYYLPYQPHATQSQFLRAYPGALEYFQIKKKYDPTNKFTNNLWDTYYNPDTIDEYATIKSVKDANVSIFENTGDYIKNIDNIYLTIPEWYIVYSAVEYANVLETGLPSQFEYRKAVKEYWKQYKEVQQYTVSTDNQNSGYQLVLTIIGWSFTFENNVKWVYESTIGRVSEILAGNKHVEEDVFAAKIARDYENFIYDNPWYDFPFYQYHNDLYRLPLSESRGVGEWMRKFERQMFLSYELVIKRFYSWLIRSAAQAEFGVQDDITTAIVREGDEFSIIQAPHYQPFTVALLKRFDEANNLGKELEVVEISGNNKVTLSYLDVPGSVVPAYSKEILRSSEIQKISGEDIIYVDRIIIEVSVKDLDNIHSDFKNRGIMMDHIYDY